MVGLIEKLEREHTLSKEEYIALIKSRTPELSELLFEKARAVREHYYGKDVYIRGLIEFTNYCKNDCYYCGIRCKNRNAERYRLTKEQIMDCCKTGYEIGFRTFVLQGGEDPYFTNERMLDIIHSIKRQYPDCALTLSVGEKNIRAILTQAQTAIFCGTKPQTTSITACCIPTVCPPKTANAVCMISKRSAFRQAAALWWVRRIRRKSI